MSALFALELNPLAGLEIASGREMGLHMAELGTHLAHDLHQQVQQDVADAARARGESSRSTGALAESADSEAELTPEGWSVRLGFSVRGGEQELAYAGVYLWGWDPTGPRADWRYRADPEDLGLVGNEVLRKILDGAGIAYTQRYPTRRSQQ